MTKFNEEFNIKNNDCLLLKSDNEVALDLLKGTFTNSIDFCYIDPPYNTGNSFIYNDRLTSAEKNTFGSHKEWMDFMSVRLILARELLSENAVIAVSIDDHEQPYLRLVMDNVFGEGNFICNIAVCRSKNGNGSSSKNVSINHEYIVIYGKTNKSKILGSDDVSSYDKEDTHGNYRIDGLFRKKGDHSLREDRPNLYYPVFYDEEGNVFADDSTGKLKCTYPLDSNGIERRWLWGKAKMAEDSWRLYASKNGIIYIKNYYDKDKRRKIKTLWSENKFLTERATLEIKEIYGEKIFETPKPTSLIENLIYVCCHKDSLILDFFAGTGTTAHAAYNLNKKDKGKRKIILVEQSKEIKRNHISFKKGFSVISDITEKRLSWIKENDNDYSYRSISLKT